MFYVYKKSIFNFFFYFILKKFNFLQIKKKKKRKKIKNKKIKKFKYIQIHLNTIKHNLKERLMLIQENNLFLI